MRKHPILAICGAALAACAGFVATASDAEARERGRRVVVTGQGDNGPFNGQVDTTARQGSRNREGVFTGPNGGQTTVRGEQTWNRDDGTFSSNRSRTFNDGTSRSVDVTGQASDGQSSWSRTATGRNGQTNTQTGAFTTSRTDTGRQTTGVITTENHGQIDVSRQTSRGPDGRTLTASQTFEDGTSITRNANQDCDRSARTCERTDVTTFRDGSTRTVTGASQGNGDGTGVWSRQATGRNGETRTQTGTYSVTPPAPQN